MAVEIRAIRPDEFEEMRRTMGLVFGFDPPEGDGRFLRLLPLDRTRCGFDDGRMISTSGAFSLEMTVPGSRVRCGGTTAVAVVPTHRRQGVLREMMRAHLADVKEHGEPIAALWASDSAIYGRFGYGCASICYNIEVDPRHATPNRLAPEPGRSRLIERAEAVEIVPPFYDSLRMEIPGFFVRTPEWWEDRSFRESGTSGGGSTALRYAVVDGDDGITGFASFRTKAHWDEGHGSGKVIVHDLFAATPEAWAAVWSLVANQDLVVRAEAGLRPPWDPIFDLLAGTRRAHAFRYDALWVRVMDVAGALAARSYSAPLDVVLGVEDPAGDVTGSYRLRADSDGAECAPTTDEPEVVLDLEDLSAGYMGRPRFRQWGRAGRLSGADDALAALDAAFTWDPQPWCPEIF
jgi:predicted acetyltransferase